MTNEDFKYWINGYLALSTEDFISKNQLTVIKNHINLVKAVEKNLDESIQQLLTFINEGINQDTTIHPHCLMPFLA